MIKDLTISADKAYERRRDFNLTTNCVSSMYLDRLGRFDAGPFRKVIVEAVPIRAGQCYQMDDVVRISRSFDFKGYWDSGAPKETLAAFLHAGLCELAERFGWPTEPLHRALSEMASQDFEYVVDWKKPVSSPSRRRTAQVRYYYGSDEVRLVAVVRAKQDGDVREVELARTPPHELKFAHLLGRLRWDGEDTVLLEPKREGSEPLTRTVS